VRWQDGDVGFCAGFSDACITKPSTRSHDRRPRSAKARNRGPEGALFRRCDPGDLRSASVCFREAGTTDARQVDGLTGRGERAPPALGSVSAWRRRSQDVGAASSSERRLRWLTVSSKNGKNGRRCVAVDNPSSRPANGRRRQRMRSILSGPRHHPCGVSRGPKQRHPQRTDFTRDHRRLRGPFSRASRCHVHNPIDLRLPAAPRAAGSRDHLLPGNCP
jgi:hypothetical protein